MDFNYKHKGKPELEVTCLIPGETDETFFGEMERVIPLIAEAVANHIMEENAPICMVLMPDGGTSIQPVSEAQSRLGEMGCEFAVNDELLLLRCEATDVAFLGDHIYLVGPVLIYEVDEDDDICNIDGETVSMAMEFFEENVTEIEVDGASYMAIRLM